MSVMGKGQAVMTDIFGSIERFCHSSYGNGFDHSLCSGSLDLSEKLVERVSKGFFGCQVHLVSQALQELNKGLEFFRVGGVMNPVNERFYRLASLLFPDFFGHPAVGEKHEILDQLVRVLHFADEDAERFAVLIQPEPHLLRFEIDRSLFKALLP